MVTQRVDGDTECGYREWIVTQRVDDDTECGTESGW